MIYTLFDENDELIARTTNETRINELMYHFWIEGIPCYLVEMTPKQYEKYCKKILDEC